jgi:hypothetical protein
MSAPTTRPLEYRVRDAIILINNTRALYHLVVGGACHATNFTRLAWTG